MLFVWLMLMAMRRSARHSNVSTGSSYSVRSSGSCVSRSIVVSERIHIISSRHPYIIHQHLSPHHQHALIIGSICGTTTWSQGPIGCSSKIMGLVGENHSCCCVCSRLCS